MPLANREVKKFLRCDLTQLELIDASRKLAKACEDINAIEDEKKVAVAQFNERSATAKAEVGRYARLASNGFEMRNVDCVVTFHTPNPSEKTITRKDTGATVEVVAMTEDELQQSFAFVGEEAKTNGEAAEQEF